MNFNMNYTFKHLTGSRENNALGAAFAHSMESRGKHELYSIAWEIEVQGKEHEKYTT